MPLAFIRPPSSEPRHLFKTWHLLEHWPQSPGIYYSYISGLELIFRGAPDLDLDPAGYPVFFQDPVGSGSGRIQKY